MRDEVRLHTPIEVTREDVENILVEHCEDEAAVAQVSEQLHGAAERAAEALNHALSVDIFDLLAQGWAQVPAVQTAVQLSALTQRPQTLINLDQHEIASTSHVVLDTHVAEQALPPLQFTLELLADIESATLAADKGRIDVVALGAASVRARLTYKGVLVKEHATEISGVPRDRSPERATDADQPATVDFPI
jgi:hypothetical protein